MSPGLARPLLHTTHLVTFAVVFVTGLLLLLPNLRAAVTGGYSLLIKDVHRWGGVAFAALPLLVIVRFGPRSIFAAPLERTPRALWQGVHVTITVAMTVIFTLSGLLIWWKRWIPMPVADTSHLVHDALTYAAAGLLALHLVEVGTAVLLVRCKAAAAAPQSHS